MNRKLSLSLFMFVIIFTLVFAGCSNNKGNGTNNTSPDEDPVENENKNENEDEDLFEVDPSIGAEIDLWTWGPQTHDKSIPLFNEIYPNIKVNVIGMDFGELHDSLQTTLAAGSGAPDVSLVEQNQFPRYSTSDLLVDLLQPPFDAGRYQDRTTEYNWERWKSVDGKRLVGMPWDITPGVFFYRQDIYEQMGLPSEPEELGEFLKDPDNVLTAAQTLAANDTYMFEWRDLPLVQHGDAIGYFDNEFNWLRNNDEMVELLDLVKRGTQLGWSPELSILHDKEGQQMARQGKVASFTSGSFAIRDLEELFPEQKDKWRVTTMPLGLSVGLGGSSWVIPSQSENKEAAWALVQWMTQSEDAWEVFVDRSVQSAYKHISSLPWYQELTSDYLGGQKYYKLFDSIHDDIPVRRLTPLDGQAWDIFIGKIHESVNDNIDSKTTLQQIEDDVMKELTDEIEDLKDELKNAVE